MPNFCTNCAAQLESGTKFCPECGAAVEVTTPSVTSNPVQGSPPTSFAVSGARYPMLRVLVSILKVLAVLAIALALISGVYILLPTSPEPSPFGLGGAFGLVTKFYSLIGMIFGFGYGLTLWAIAGIIQVEIDIEENTRQATTVLSQIEGNTRPAAARAAA